MLGPMKHIALAAALAACGAPPPPGALNRIESTSGASDEVRALLAQLEAIAAAAPPAREGEVATLEGLSLDGDAAEVQRSCAAMFRSVLAIQGAARAASLDPESVFATQRTCEHALQRVLVEQDVPLDALATVGFPPLEFTLEGELSEDDSHTASGEPHDDYTILVEKDWRIEITMRSNAVDPYLLLQTLDDTVIVQNDDAEGGTSDARVEHVAADRGLFVVRATSLGRREPGPYQLRVVAPAARRASP
jgi:hypothetical protein